MDEGGEERSGEVDWISKLPDCLLCQILLNLPTKSVVKTSALSSRWRNLWKYVPALDLDYDDFSDHNSFVSFVDTFLGFNSESSCLQSFKLQYDCDGPEIDPIRRWINTVVNRKVKHLDVYDTSSRCEVQMPSTLYTCESLVCLKLSGVGVVLASPKFVSLPSLKVLDLADVKFAVDLALETLISRCPVLERLFIEKSSCDGIEVLRVCSQCLLSFTYVGTWQWVPGLVLEINAPRLKYLKVIDYRVTNFVLNHPSSLVEAYIDATFDPNPYDIILIRNFLRGISCVKDMTITSHTLEGIYEYSRCEQLPLFRKLSFLRVEFTSYRWEMLPIFLEYCPNLKSLVLESTGDPEQEGNSIISGPRCFLSSLEYVEIVTPLKGDAMEMKLVTYLLENSTILKKLTLCLDESTKKEESVIFKELLTIPRLSSACQVVVR